MIVWISFIILVAKVTILSGKYGLPSYQHTYKAGYLPFTQCSPQYLHLSVRGFPPLLLGWELSFFLCLYYCLCCPEIWAVHSGHGQSDRSQATDNNLQEANSKQPKAIANDASEAPNILCQAVLQTWTTDAHKRHPISSISAHHWDNPRDLRLHDLLPQAVGRGETGDWGHRYLSLWLVRDYIKSEKPPTMKAPSKY